MEPRHSAGRASSLDLADDPAAQASALARPPRPLTLVLHLLLLWLLAPALVLVFKHLFG
ncbi:hypothetical protein RA210_U180007 [Rubrivivax sp. A210]|uniref:hypothetical protein n=1 Tax=Rubrivivax sp. A210 TaxID=2772301 RepID=UPI00191A8D1E|nr:hypothetical protein [Rubrivivax sp. A210]CAD5371866.1 hypothetical protein RA210_U180007 [Rubrivivax sp. A210]